MRTIDDYVNMGYTASEVTVSGRRFCLLLTKPDQYTIAVMLDGERVGSWNPNNGSSEHRCKYVAHFDQPKLDIECAKLYGRQFQ